MKIYSKLIVIALLIFTSSLASAEDTGLEGKDVSAYLEGSYIDVQTATEKLKRLGYEIVATYAPVKKGHTIVFTNDALRAEGAKPKRAHAAVLRLFIDDKEKTISFTNPVYFGKAFMQDDYNHAVFNTQLNKISASFEELKSSADKMEFDDLAGYHYMMGMPYYEDVDELGEATNEELLSRARAYKKGKLLIFELKLSDKSTLLGYELSKRTKKFVKKIGRANAAVLPYCISVEDGLASSLAGKYYLAVSYPRLSMGEFTTIATVPGAIIKDLKKAFK
ncbi:hypothetical protein [Sulfurimonas sp.]